MKKKALLVGKEEGRKEGQTNKFISELGIVETIFRLTKEVEKHILGHL